MIYLASKSPRRRELLARLGVEFETIETGITERIADNESPPEYLCRVALEKARAAQNMIDNSGGRILAADTEVVLNGRILGKPQDLQEAVAMLLSLSDRVHEVYSAVVLLDGDTRTILNHNRVWFRALDRAECEQYCLSGEPFDKAGGYGIQGRAAGFVRRLEGSYSGVMGLPLAETRQLLGNWGQTTILSELRTVNCQSENRGLSPISKEIVIIGCMGNDHH